jgi:hypothetical protein
MSKLISSSTVIEEAIRTCQPSSAVSFFYFDFNDAEKQRCDSLIRSLIVQLSSQSTNTPKALTELYSRHRGGQQTPAPKELMETLREAINELDHTYIILDALDECTERKQLLELIDEITQWNLQKLHVLVTSRRERDIEEGLKCLLEDQICIQSTLVNADIRLHIHEKIQCDRKLSKWSAQIQDEIEEALMRGANGMYG